MKMEVVNENLFNAGSEYMLAHCISSDARMGAGIARLFREKYPGMSDYCRAIKPKVGDVVLHRNVYNLITKQYYYDKPLRGSFELAVIRLQRAMSSNLHTKLAIPLLGCGLDRLSWDYVSGVLVNTFKDTDIEIKVFIKEKAIYEDIQKDKVFYKLDGGSPPT